MADLFNSDFKEFLQALTTCKVRYLLVGGYSVIIHGYPRNTGDLDIWVERSPMNYEHLKKAFFLFGMPLFDMTEDNFFNSEKFDVFTFGRPPVCIEILTQVKGLEFQEAFQEAKIYREDGISIPCIQFHHLITAKKAAGRARDLNDIENLLKSKE